jgi:hypothetical protein
VEQKCFPYLWSVLNCAAKIFRPDRDERIFKQEEQYDPVEDSEKSGWMGPFLWNNYMALIYNN